jgi:hypothetical protein
MFIFRLLSVSSARVSDVMSTVKLPNRTCISWVRVLKYLGDILGRIEGPVKEPEYG